VSVKRNGAKERVAKAKGVHCVGRRGGQKGKGDNLETSE